MTLSPIAIKHYFGLVLLMELYHHTLAKFLIMKQFFINVRILPFEIYF